MGKPLRFFRSLYLLAPLVAVTGCAGLVGTGEDAAYSKVPVGSVLRIERRIPIAPGRARAWLKGGRVSVSSGSNRPVCGLEVRNLDRGAVQYVEPGEFRIGRVQNLQTQIVLAPQRSNGAVRLRLASIGGGGGDGGGGTPNIYEGYHLWLENPDQPNVMRMTCIGVFDEMWRARPPTVLEIRDSLGSLATLEIDRPEGSPAQ